MKYIIPIIQIILVTTAIVFFIVGWTTDDDYLMWFVTCWIITGIVQPICAAILTWQYWKVKPFPRSLTYYWLFAVMALVIYFLIVPTYAVAVYFTVITWKLALKKQNVGV